MLGFCESDGHPEPTDSVGLTSFVFASCQAQLSELDGAGVDKTLLGAFTSTFSRLRCILQFRTRIHTTSLMSMLLLFFVRFPLVLSSSSALVSQSSTTTPAYTRSRRPTTETHCAMRWKSCQILCPQKLVSPTSPTSPITR